MTNNNQPQREMTQREKELTTLVEKYGELWAQLRDQADDLVRSLQQVYTTMGRVEANQQMIVEKLRAEQEQQNDQ